MKQKIWIVLLLMALVLTACQSGPIPVLCDHVWREADCMAPKTCTLCGETEGGVKAHDWQGATCTEPKTCTVCGETYGKAKGHDFGKATCTEPAACERCGETEGEALGHNFSAATCVKPATCGRCGETQGEALGHDFEEATCTTARKCKVCRATEGKALGHDYQKNVCTVCGDKMIETHQELESYLMKNFRTLTTTIGTLKYLNIEVEVNDPNYWHNQDFEVQIESTLWFEEVDCSLGYALVYADFIPYEQRIQAVVDVLNYQKAIVEVAEAAFPGQKFEVKFYTWGYEYPNIQVGFNSETMMCWRNWERRTNSPTGYAGSYLIDWEIYTFDALSYGTYDKKQQILADIRKAWPENPIDNY